MTRRILIDDIRRFKDVFGLDYQSPKDDTEVVARDYNAGVQLLATNSWDELYLDHDLGDHSKTGYDVMCWLEEHSNRLPPKVFFVSANPVGVERMKRVLERMKQCPTTSNSSTQ